MPQPNIPGLVVAVFATTALIACSGTSPAAPSAEPSSLSADGIGVLDAQAVEGSYTLYLTTTTGQVVSTLPTEPPGTELLLWAQVRDSSGTLATGGRVIFQACMQQRTWVPSAECESGEAHWTHVATVRVDEGSCLPFAPESGNACLTFGGMRTPITIGFRYRYIGQGSGIANGVSASQDMTWVAVP
jgi:hypothetical protein